MADLLLGESGDVAIDRGDLVLDTGLGSAVLRSLLTDRRATPEELARVGVRDPRGWWGEASGDEYGSALWLLAREVRVEGTLARARELARAALRWLVEDGIAQSVDVAATFVGQEMLHLAVRVRRGRATKWAHLWSRPQPAHLETERLTLAVLLEDTRR